MTLEELLRPIQPIRVTGPAGVAITGLNHDSRRVKPGDLFFALPGLKTDGNRHVAEAARRGAAAVISELDPDGGFSGAWVKVSSLVSSMGLLADFFYGHPSGALKIFGVTGTNGKTTTTYFLESIVSACGGRPGVAGTINYRLDGKPLESSVNTTPISLHIQRLLAQFRDGGASHVAMEVSSHALALKRVDEIDFDAAIFTNLRRDHLDFHKTTEEYFRSKARLFELLNRAASSNKNRVAAINHDDPTCERLKSLCSSCRVVTYGLGAASLRAENREMTLAGTRFDLVHDGKRLSARLALIGEHNVYNALAAAAAALGLGMDQAGVVAGLAALRCVPGRLEPVDSGQDFHVFVDYAHTDSALETVLTYLAKLPHRRLITVFGCGGDRDKTKRGPMGAAACRFSDLAIVTSDNPRGEEPSAIIGDIEDGLKTGGHKNYKIEADRRLAIEEAIGLAQAGDIVLIAGKGHEDYQILKDRTIHFDDREIAVLALRKRL